MCAHTKSLPSPSHEASRRLPVGAGSTWLLNGDNRKFTAVELDNVVPWGTSLDASWFALSDADLCSRLLGCGDGPASFNSMLGHGTIQMSACHTHATDERKRYALERMSGSQNLGHIPVTQIEAASSDRL
jgi:hypothetical protein